MADSRYTYRRLKPFSFAVTLGIAALLAVTLLQYLGKASSRPFWIANFTLLGITLVWVYQAIANCWALGATGMRFRPATAVGASILPIANIYFGYKIFQEAWSHSYGPTRTRPTGLITTWWRLFVFGKVLAVGVGIPLMLLARESPDTALLLARVFTIVFACVDLIALGLYSTIVWKIAARQEDARRRALVMNAGDQPVVGVGTAGEGWTRGFTIPEVGILVAILGVAIVAPAFLTMMKKSRDDIVVMELRHIYTGLKYYMMDHDGQLPPSVGPTPPVDTCCQQGSGPPCATDRALWDDPVWREIDFRPEGMTRYSYELVNDGKQFTLRALADADCDGMTYATWEVVVDIAAMPGEMPKPTAHNERD